jgi:hypothetical protein
MPQISVKRDINGVNIVTVIYSGLAVGFSNAELSQNYRHIWEHGTELDGQKTWGLFTDWTGDVLHLFSECVYPSVFPVNHNNTSTPDTIHTLYQTDNLPGNSIQPTGGNHAPVSNNMVHLQIFPPAVGITGIANTSIEVSQNIPNPAFEKTAVDVSTNHAATLQISVNNLLGQQIFSEKMVTNAAGSFRFNIDVSEWNSGIYFYTVTVGNKSVSKKMIVK